MSSPRLNRLQNDYAQLRARFDGHPYIQVSPRGTVPPEEYQIVYSLPALVLDERNQPRRIQRTFVTLSLPHGYPKQKPHAVANEKIFHPNFSDYICIADFWSPAQSLADIVLEIGQMLQWQKYNIQSPLNAVAAEWSVENGDDLPIGNLDVFTASGSPKVSIHPQEKA